MRDADASQSPDESRISVGQARCPPVGPGYANVDTYTKEDSSPAQCCKKCGTIYVLKKGVQDLALKGNPGASEDGSVKSQPILEALQGEYARCPPVCPGYANDDTYIKEDSSLTQCCKKCGTIYVLKKEVKDLVLNPGASEDGSVKSVPILEPLQGEHARCPGYANDDTYTKEDSSPAQCCKKCGTIHVLKKGVKDLALKRNLGASEDGTVKTQPILEALQGEHARCPPVCPGYANDDTYTKEDSSPTQCCKKCGTIHVLKKGVKDLALKGNPGASEDGTVKTQPILEALQGEHESVCRSSEFESPSSSCASARAQYYHNQLLATLKILQNKEETVKVQSESLAVAEARIDSLTARSNELKEELQRKGRDLKALWEKTQRSKVEKIDVSVTAKDLENQNIVTVLQNKLSVIEELYRECFYETAKQEGLIEMLRKSYLDVRLMDKQKSDQISRLHNVIITQKWSLHQFQDIASDVDHLKVEISNFLNNSNNDSGMWEESSAGTFTEDLQGIAGQLLRLRELLTGDCICGLEEENQKLRQSNEEYQIQINELNQKIADLENTITNKDYSDKELQDLIERKENELHSIREHLAAMADQGQVCESMKVQLHHAQELLTDTASKLTLREAQCKHQERTVRTLRDQLDQTEDVNKEYCSLRGATCAAREQVSSLRTELKLALQHCAQMDDSHRAEVKSLETALREAHTRGAALCAEARRAMHGVRAWTQRRRQMQKELEEQINQKECQIKKLKHGLERERNNATLTRESERLTEVDNRSTQCDCVKSFSNRELEEQIKQQESEIKLLKQKLEKENTFNLTRESERLTQFENRSTNCECEKTEMLLSYRDLEKQIIQKESQIKLLKQRLEREENNHTLARETERVIEIENRCTQCDCGKSLFEDYSCNRNRSGETSGSKRQTTPSFNSPQGRKTGEIPFEKSGRGMASSTPLPACPNATQRSPQTFIKRFFGDRWFCSPSYHEAIVQNPLRSEAMTSSSDLEEPSCSNHQTNLRLISGNRERPEQPCEASTSGIDSSTLYLASPSASLASPSPFREQFVKKRYSDNRLSTQDPPRGEASRSEGAYRAAHTTGLCQVMPPATVLRASRSGARGRPQREYGSVEDVLRRMEVAGAAVQDSLQRWNRRA